MWPDPHSFVSYSSKVAYCVVSYLIFIRRLRPCTFCAAWRGYIVVSFLSIFQDALAWNLKDNKRGWEINTNYIKEELGEEFHKRFPNINNIRFESYGLAAAELILYREQHIRHLDVSHFLKRAMHD